MGWSGRAMATPLPCGTYRTRRWVMRGEAESGPQPGVKMTALFAPAPAGAPRDPPVADAPFASDLEYLQEEMRWVETRCRRIAAEVALQRYELDEQSRRHRMEDASPRERCGAPAGPRPRRGSASRWTAGSRPTPRRTARPSR